MTEEVHLGLPGPWAEDYREKADHYTTKIGGVPDWPTQDLGIEPELLQCRLCGSRLCLVAQVYAPVAKLNIEERTLYVLVCPASKCSSNPKSWKVLRAQKCNSGMRTNGSVDELVQRKENVCSSQPPPSDSVGRHNEENKSNNSNDDDFDLDALAEALEQAATLASDTKKKTKSKRANNVPTRCAAVKEKVNDLSIPVLPCFYIYYDKEQSRGKSNVCSTSNETVSVEEIMDMGNDEEEKWEGEKYEYDSAPGADRTFLKFKKRLDAYPQQCFRYSYAGKPLLAAKYSQDVGTSCVMKGSKHSSYQNRTVFIVCIAVLFLDQAGDGSANCAPNAWSWLTLVVYSRSKNCCPWSCGGKRANCCWGAVEEEIMIQEDEACNA